MNRSHYILHLLSEVVTLQSHDTLNPQLWDIATNTPKPDVREHLLKIARLWRDFAKIPVKSVMDIVFLGGNVGFFFTPYSDIDLHLVIRKADLGSEPDLVEEYILTKKDLWAQKHEDITIYNYPVEIYAEDINAKHPAGQGRYSLLHNKWLIVPQKQPVDYDDPHLLRKIEHYKRRIDRMIAGVGSGSSSDAAYKRLKKSLKNMRDSSLQQGGDLAMENLIFKELRNEQYLTKLNNYFHTRQDTQLSLFPQKTTMTDESQQLPYSVPGFQNPHPVKSQLRQSAATRYAKKLRSIQRERFFRKAISASWKTPKAITPVLTPSQQRGR